MAKADWSFLAFAGLLATVVGTANLTAQERTAAKSIDRRDEPVRPGTKLAEAPEPFATTYQLTFHLPGPNDGELIGRTYCASPAYRIALSRATVDSAFSFEVEGMLVPIPDSEFLLLSYAVHVVHEDHNKETETEAESSGSVRIKPGTRQSLAEFLGKAIEAEVTDLK